MKKGLALSKIVILTLVLLFSGCTMSSTDEPNGDTDIPIGLYVSSSGDQEYSSIQDAIDAAPENYTVYVFSGMYTETVVINKTIQLMGEDPSTTIIDAKKLGAVIKITDAEYCNVSGFTIQNAGSNQAGLDMRSGNNNISNNIIKDNTNGINSNAVKYNIYFNNTFISNSNYAVYISSESNYNVLKKNVFTNNSCALRIKGSRFNQVLMNVFQGNERGMYFCCGARSNVAYHNNFFDNSLWNGNDYVGGNTWYDESTSQGNYWDDYTGIDADEDGIGDTPYDVTSDGTKQDLYPLMNPIGLA